MKKIFLVALAAATMLTSCNGSCSAEGAKADSLSTTYGEMVGEIAKLYDYCYFIDIIKCSDVTLMSDSSYVSFDHFSIQGYIALAKNIMKEVNRIISDNMQDFVYIGYDNQYL